MLLVQPVIYRPSVINTKDYQVYFNNSNEKAISMMVELYRAIVFPLFKLYLPIPGKICLDIFP